MISSKSKIYLNKSRFSLSKKVAEFNVLCKAQFKTSFCFNFPS